MRKVEHLFIYRRGTEGYQTTKTYLGTTNQGQGYLNVPNDLGNR